LIKKVMEYHSKICIYVTKFERTTFIDKIKYDEKSTIVYGVVEFRSHLLSMYCRNQLPNFGPIARKKIDIRSRKMVT
jgi:hypothetical protein